MNQEKKFEDFTPSGGWTGWSSIRCPKDGNMMISIASSPVTKEGYLTCKDGACGHHTVIDHWTLWYFDTLEEAMLRDYPTSCRASHRPQTFQIGNETTSSTEKYLNWVEKKFDVTIDKNLRKFLHAHRPYLKIYVAGAYSDPDRNKVIHNVFAAIDAGIRVMQKGHQVFVPHAMTWAMDTRAKSTGLSITYDEWTELDDTFLRDWADALLLISNSPGADHEVEKAVALGKKVYRSVGEIPDGE